MLELKRISTGYGINKRHPRHRSTVAPGEIVALVGANGAGKSTLVKTIAGLLALRAGEIVLDTKRIDKLNSRARVLAGVSMVPEGRQVFGALTVIENLRLGAYARRGEIDKVQSGAAYRSRLRAVSDFGATTSRAGQQSVWRPAADAGDWTRPDGRTAYLGAR